MLKTFTLNNRIDKQLSDTAGTVIFSVIDEDNNIREVSADTFLDENYLPQGVTASSKRELPLVEGLFRMEVGEQTEIDFTLYNKFFSREVNKTSNQIAYEEVLKMQKENSLIGKIRKLFKLNKNNNEETATS